MVFARRSRFLLGHTACSPGRTVDFREGTPQKTNLKPKNHPPKLNQEHPLPNLHFWLVMDKSTILLVFAKKDAIFFHGRNMLVYLLQTSSNTTSGPTFTLHTTAATKAAASAQQACRRHPPRVSCRLRYPTCWGKENHRLKTLPWVGIFYFPGRELVFVAICLLSLVTKMLL